MSRPPCGSFWCTRCSCWTSVCVSSVCLRGRLSVGGMCNICMHMCVGDACRAVSTCVSRLHPGSSVYQHSAPVYCLFSLRHFFDKELVTAISERRWVHESAFVQNNKGNPGFKCKFLILTQQHCFLLEGGSFLPFWKEWKITPNSFLFVVFMWLVTVLHLVHDSLGAGRRQLWPSSSDP